MVEIIDLLLKWLPYLIQRGFDVAHAYDNREVLKAQLIAWNEMDTEPTDADFDALIAQIDANSKIIKEM